MATEEKQNKLGQLTTDVLVMTNDQIFENEEITSPMNESLEEKKPFYSRNRRYSRYRSSRGGRNSLM